MNENKQHLFMIRGAIDSLPETDQLKVKEAAATLREMIGRGSETYSIAIALVFAEMSAEGS